MLLDQKVKIKRHNRYARHYESLGYDAAGNEGYFEVRVEHLQKGSEVAVLYECDYCQIVKTKPYKSLITSRALISKDCCEDDRCRVAKRREPRVIPAGESLGDVYPLISKQWVSEMNNKTPLDYRPHSGKKVWWRCEHGHVWEAQIFKRTKLGRGCHYCTGRKVNYQNCLASKRPDVAVEWDAVRNGSNTPYEVTFCSAKKAWWICSEGHQWESKISNRVNGSGCPVCNESKGERAVRDWLIGNNIRFEAEFTFEGLVGISDGLLRYDFAALTEPGELVSLIEYDGEFHFHNIFNDGRYELTKEHDKLKNEFCEKQGIQLIRIPYTKFGEIENILTSRLLPTFEKMKGSTEICG